MDEHTCGYEHDPATTSCEEAETYWHGEWQAEAEAEMAAETAAERYFEEGGPNAWMEQAAFEAWEMGHVF